MKVISMMILGFGFIGNVAAACPQDIGYIGPVDVLPACESGHVLADLKSRAQPIQKVLANEVEGAVEMKREATAEAHPVCPRDIGYLAPVEMLPPCSDLDSVAAPELTADAARIEVKVSEVR